VASHVPDEANHYRLFFGPANVGIHYVAALVSLGEAAWQLKLCGLRDEALAKLLEAEQLAPREVNCRPVARGTIEHLMERSRGKPPSALRSLAERAGATA
jgi:hypothetical protein